MDVTDKCALCGVTREEHKKSGRRGLHKFAELEVNPTDDDRIRAAHNLLAVMHRDGGQHTAEVGFVQSCKDAEQVRHEMANQIDRYAMAPTSDGGFRFQWRDRALRAEAALDLVQRAANLATGISDEFRAQLIDISKAGRPE